MICTMTNLTDIASNYRNAALIEKCKKAAKRPMTEKQRFDQKVSFVMGMLSHKSTATRADIVKIVKKIEGIEDDSS